MKYLYLCTVKHQRGVRCGLRLYPQNLMQVMLP